MAEQEQIKPGVSKKEGEVLENGLMITKINIRPVQRTKLDIEKWRNSHKAAEGINGSRIAYYDLCADVLLDGFLKRLVAKRVLAVTKNKLKYIDKSGKEIDGASEVLKLQQFRKLRKRIQLYKAWGISVIELMNVDGMLKIFDVPKKHILTKEGKIIYDQSGIDGLEYRKPPYNKTVIEVGDWDDLGYLLEACAYAIYKRGDIADWANYAQIFGMPFREARYDGFNEVVRLQLETALEAAASAAWMVLPKDAEFTLHEASNASGSNELYDTLRRAMNEEMSVLILGATETTTSSKSSGYAQSETHQKTVDEVAADDKEDELSILNEQVVPILAYLGLLPAGGSFIYDEPVNVEVAAKKVAIAKTVKELGVPISDEYLYEISGIPKPDNYEELKTKQENEKKLQSQQEVDDKTGSDKLPGPAGKKGVKKIKAEKKKLSRLDEFRLMLSDFFGHAHKS